MLCVRRRPTHAHVAREAPVYFGGEHRIVAVGPARQAGVEHLQRDAELLVRERAAGDERFPTAARSPGCSSRIFTPTPAAR